MTGLSRYLVIALLAVCAAATSGCASIVQSASNQLADDLSAAILNQDDPELVREGMPAFMLLLDSRVRSFSRQPRDAGFRRRYCMPSTGSAFVDDPERAQIADESRSRDYGARSLCARSPDNMREI